MEILKSLLTGISCGIVFSLFKLPIPAPPVVAGIVGIVGIFIGYKLISFFV